MGCISKVICVIYFYYEMAIYSSEMRSCEMCACIQQVYGDTISGIIHKQKHTQDIIAKSVFPH